jgi:phosphate transport system permease protein
MVLPILIRSMETALRAVPGEHRLAVAALGLPQRVSLLHIVLPAAAPGLAVGLILGIGRALAETAALLFTSGYGDRLPDSLLDSGRALSVHIFDLAMNVPGGASQASASALVLVALVLLINGVTAWAGRRWLGSLGAAGL